MDTFIMSSKLRTFATDPSGDQIVPSVKQCFILDHLNNHYLVITIGSYI